MSRTRKGRKGPGYEYWSRRPCPGSKWGPPGKLGKRVTHKAERRASRDKLIEEVRID